VEDDRRQHQVEQEPLLEVDEVGGIDLVEAEVVGAEGRQAGGQDIQQEEGVPFPVQLHPTSSNGSVLVGGWPGNGSRRCPGRESDITGPEISIRSAANLRTG